MSSLTARGLQWNCFLLLAIHLDLSKPPQVVHALQHVTHANQRTTLPVLEVPIGRLRQQPGQEQQQTSAEMDELLNDNLRVDLQHWRDKEGPLSVERVLRLRDEMKAHDVDDCLKMVLIYNNTWLFPDRRDVGNTSCPMPCNQHMEVITGVMQSALSHQEVKFPNVLFVLNVNDNCPRWCSQKANCSAPLFSLQKHLFGDHGMDRDILVPQMVFVPRAAYFYPWQLKEDKAFFRGEARGECYKSPGFVDYSVRSYLAHRTQAAPGGKLDVGLTSGFRPLRNQEGKSLDFHLPEDIPKAASVAIKEHARYKYLLSLEGITASSRLPLLMTTNSIILKSHAPTGEYFYRSLKEGVHITTIWNTSVDDVDDALAALHEQEAADSHSVYVRTHATQSFALKYLTMQARVQYWAAALTEYKQMVPDMDAYIDKLIPDLVAKGLNFDTSVMHRQS